MLINACDAWWARHEIVFWGIIVWAALLILISAVRLFWGWWSGLWRKIELAERAMEEEEAGEQ